MRLSVTPISIPVGNVEIHDMFRVIELDAGHSVGTNEYNTPRGGVSDPTTMQSTVAFSCEILYAIESRIAIVVPCMNEAREVLEGVLQGVPHNCLIIVV